MTDARSEVRDTDHDDASPTLPRYAAVTADGDTVIYDTEQPTAWLQSSQSVDITEVR